MGDISVDYLVGKLNNAMDNLSHTKAIKHITTDDQKNYIVRYFKEVERRTIDPNSIYVIGKLGDTTTFKIIDTYDNSTTYVEALLKDNRIYISTFERFDGGHYDLSI